MLGHGEKIDDETNVEEENDEENEKGPALIQTADHGSIENVARSNQNLQSTAARNSVEQNDEIMERDRMMTP